MAARFAFSTVAGGAADETAPPPDDVMEKIAAGAFDRLCEHLRLHGDRVQNIDLMTVGGFCRNCLAKWMVLEARKLSKRIRSDEGNASEFANRGEGECHSIIGALDSFGYDEAAKEVYGTTYPEWKKRHQKKATKEQLRLYKESTAIHAIHDADLLQKADGVDGCGLSERVLVRLRAGAFLSLCLHLRERSDAVQNIELMSIGGFCRNCLAKWLVVEARSISDQIRNKGGSVSLVRPLDSFGYDEGAQYVYGCLYPEWKKHHQKKATDEQMERYNGSKVFHAKHDKELLATRATKVPATHSDGGQVCVKGGTPQSNILSDVCCQDVDAIATPSDAGPRSLTYSQQMPRPPKGDLSLKVAILTVSDRAAANEYDSGDLSGPAVENAVNRLVENANAMFPDQSITVSRTEKKIVPDEMADIKEALRGWSDASSGFDLVFTTGGTGFSRRDVTPEATNTVLDRKCEGLMSWASAALTAKQPLATLSRAAAGIRGNTLIVNLPGNPAGAAQVVELLFPLLVHAIKDMMSSH